MGWIREIPCSYGGDRRVDDERLARAISRADIDTNEPLYVHKQ